jgi:hypothetical protein
MVPIVNPILKKLMGYLNKDKSSSMDDEDKFEQINQVNPFVSSAVSSSIPNNHFASLDNYFSSGAGPDSGTQDESPKFSGAPNKLSSIKSLLNAESMPGEFPKTHSGQYQQEQPAQETNTLNEPSSSEQWADNPDENEGDQEVASFDSESGDGSEFSDSIKAADKKDDEDNKMFGEGLDQMAKGFGGKFDPSVFTRKYIT